MPASHRRPVSTPLVGAIAVAVAAGLVLAGCSSFGAAGEEEEGDAVRPPNDGGSSADGASSGGAAETGATGPCPPELPIAHVIDEDFEGASFFPDFQVKKSSAGASLARVAGAGTDNSAALVGTFTLASGDGLFGVFERRFALAPRDITVELDLRPPPPTPDFYAEIGCELYFFDGSVDDPRTSVGLIKFGKYAPQLTAGWRPSAPEAERKTRTLGSSSAVFQHVRVHVTVAADGRTGHADVDVDGDQDDFEFSLHVAPKVVAFRCGFPYADSAVGTFESAIDNVHARICGTSP